jgi:hypothetical protein
MELLSSLPWEFDFRGNPSASVISPALLERRGDGRIFPVLSSNILHRLICFRDPAQSVEGEAFPK